MKRPLQIVLLLIMCMPAHAQFSMKMHKSTYEIKPVFSVVNFREVQQGQKPSRSLVYYSADSSQKPDTLSYDRFGNMTERVNSFNRESKEYYGESGIALLNSISYIREQENAPWRVYDVELRTTLNGKGIRTAMISNDYKEIRLNEKGYVISYDDSENETEIDKATYVWDGDKLKSVISEFSIIEDGEEYAERIVMNDINIVYEKKPFNRYEIDYSEYLINLPESGVAYNATGTYSEGADAVPQNLTISSKVSEDKKVITMEYKFGDVIKSEKLTYTDDNGSYSYECNYPDGTLELNTVSCNQYGDVTNESYKELEDGKEVEVRNYRYVWTYEEGKPTKRETYNTYNKQEEQLMNTEYFIAWYGGTDIRSIRNDIRGKILNATLFTLSGALVKTLQAEEVNHAFELPDKGIYLLRIHTTEGVVVKKLIK